MNSSSVPIHWTGHPPGAELAAALRKAGLSPSAQSEGAQARVAATSEARAPHGVAADLPWIWLCARAVPPAAATDAVSRGAYDAVSLAAPGAAQRLIKRLREMLVPEPPPAPAAHLIAQSPAARRMLARVARAARTSMPVLLTGETGTGKEVVARLIHTWSARADRPYVPINCAAIPNALMEGELFGYAKGAFSGATQGFEGRLSSAEGGTVCLDEIDDTPLPTQVKLLRVLEDRVVTRLGETVQRKVDFRILAATNRDLRQLIDRGQFGPDLFERLAIVSIRLPPLRERVEDLPALVAHLMERFYAEEPEGDEHARVRAVSPEALAAIAAYPWPGNIRELRNVVFQALVYKRAGNELLLSDLPRRILKRETPRERSVVDAAELARRIDAGTMDLARSRDELEREAIRCALERAKGNASQAARLLGCVGRGAARDPGGTLRAMMRRHGIAPGEGG